MDAPLFAAWNLVPIAIAYWVADTGAKSRGLARVRHFLFATIACVVPTVFHVAWILDWDGIATGSSTAGVAFFWIPLLAVLCASLASFALWIFPMVASLHRP